MIARGPAAFGYARISTMKQWESGLSPKAQKSLITRYYEFKLKDKGVIWGDIYGDDEKHISGGTPFLNRVAGRDLDVQLQPGDHILFSSLDRAWRNHLDTVTMLQRWADKGISVHFIGEGIEFSQDNPFGKAMLLVMSVFAQLEREMAARRTRAALAAKKERGELTGGAVRDIRYKTTHKGTRRQADHHNRRILAHALWLREQQGLGETEIWKLLNKERLRLSNGRRVGIHYCRVEYLAKCEEAGIKPERFPDALRPTKVPKRSR